MDTQQSSTLPEPLRTAASALRRVPGAVAVGRVAEGTLDKIGAVSPRGRRLAVYTGAGVLGVAGVVEWPVALTGAAVAWLTQPKPQERQSAGPATGPAEAADPDKRSTSRKKTGSSHGKSPARTGATTGRSGLVG